MKTLIQSVTGRRLWDSRGRPTVEAEITLQGGARGRAIARAGASTGAAAVAAAAGASTSRASASLSAERPGSATRRPDRAKARELLEGPVLVTTEHAPRGPVAFGEIRDPHGVDVEDDEGEQETDAAAGDRL